MVCCCHGGLPHHAFLNFAVAHHHIGVVILPVQPCAERHAHTDGQAVAQRTRCHIHAGGDVHIRVALQNAFELAQGVQLFHIKIPTVGQRRIIHRAAVALGKNKAVTARVFGIFRVDVHHMKIQCGDHFGSGKAAAGVAGACFVDHVHHIAAKLSALVLQQFYILRREAIHIFAPFWLTGIDRLFPKALVLSVSLSYRTKPSWSNTDSLL